MSSLNPPSSSSSAPTSSTTSATQTKERLYAQLAMSLGRTSRAISQTADLCEQLQVDLHAMRIFAGLDAAKFMTVAAQLNPEDEDEDEEVEGGEAGNEPEEKGAAKQQNNTNASKPKGSQKAKERDQ